MYTVQYLICGFSSHLYFSPILNGDERQEKERRGSMKGEEKDKGEGEWEGRSCTDETE